MKRIIQMIRITSYFLLPLLLPSALSAQKENRYVPQPISSKASSHEIGIFLGGSYYIGDLNPIGHFNRFTRPAAGALYRMNFNSRLSAKAIASFGIIEANDSYSLSESHRNRNLNFKSKIAEMAVEGEFNFLPFKTGNKKFALTSPYIFAGVAVYNYNPTGYYDDRWHTLQPLGTEGQGTTFGPSRSYSLTQVSIPFGVGFKMNTAKRIGIAFEWGLRKTFNDYLDDVSGKYVDPVLLASEKGPIAAGLSDKSLVKEGGSNVGRQRGNSYTKDWYSFAGVIIIFKLRDNKYECDVPH